MDREVALSTPCGCYEVIVDISSVQQYAFTLVTCKRKDDLYYYENWIHCEKCEDEKPHMRLILDACSQIKSIPS